ncbi:MAG: DUF4870 domain-containing protein [Proteobacteria bacterium]|nr:DUF4870 domain-containing protein [Pseudomonadota bacterium]
MQPGSENESSAADKSSTGLDANLAGLLCYFGFFVTGIAFLVLEKKSSFVRFHAMQSTFVFIGLFVLNFVAHLIPILGPTLHLIIRIAAIVLWVVLMVQAFRGERYKLPLVGDMAEQQLGQS